MNGKPEGDCPFNAFAEPHLVVLFMEGYHIAATQETLTQEHKGTVPFLSAPAHSDIGLDLAAALSRLPAVSYIYVVGHRTYNAVKVGISRQPKKRKATLQAQCCQELEIYALFAFQDEGDAAQVERMAINQLRAVWGRPQKRPPYQGREWCRCVPHKAVEAIEETCIGRRLRPSRKLNAALNEPPKLEFTEPSPHPRWLREHIENREGRA
jgi:hypothetical protein